MYIVAIAWLYVLLLISIMQPTVFRGIVTFVGAGLFPLGLLLYLVGTPRRRRDLAGREEAPQEQPETKTSEASGPMHESSGTRPDESSGTPTAESPGTPSADSLDAPTAGSLAAPPRPLS